MHIEHYSVIREDRDRHRGVAIFIRNDLVFNCRNEILHNDFEALWIEILLIKSKPIVCGCLFRTPSQNDYLARLSLIYLVLNLD